nr:MAG TPA: hypothetical protein [Caudoviricetes sp.]
MFPLTVIFIVVRSFLWWSLSFSDIIALERGC